MAPTVYMRIIAVYIYCSSVGVNFSSHSGVTLGKDTVHVKKKDAETVIWDKSKLQFSSVSDATGYFYN